MGGMQGRFPNPMGMDMYMVGPEGYMPEGMLMDPNNPYMAQMMMARGMMGTSPRECASREARPDRADRPCPRGSAARNGARQ